VPTAFQGSKCVHGGLKRREYQVKARCQIRANALLPILYGVWHTKGGLGGGGYIALKGLTLTLALTLTRVDTVGRNLMDRGGGEDSNLVFRRVIRLVQSLHTMIVSDRNQTTENEMCE